MAFLRTNFTFCVKLAMAFNKRVQMYEVSSHQINHINYEDDTLMFEENDKMFIIVIF